MIWDWHSIHTYLNFLNLQTISILEYSNQSQILDVGSDQLGTRFCLALIRRTPQTCGEKSAGTRSTSSTFEHRIKYDRMEMIVDTISWISPTTTVFATLVGVPTAPYKSLNWYGFMRMLTSHSRSRDTRTPVEPTEDCTLWLSRPGCSRHRTW